MDRATQPAGVVLPSDLNQARVTRLPATVYYIPDFVSKEEEQILLEKVRLFITQLGSTGRYKQRFGWTYCDQIACAPKPRWKQLSHRRLQIWPSELVQNRLLDAPLPSWLDDPIVSRLLSIPLDSGGGGDSAHLFASSPHKRPNHVLINEYPPGVGIMPHKDGPAYHPVVCTVSLGASLCLDIYTSKEDGVLNSTPAHKILQEPRSLLISTDDIYTECLHGIADVEDDVQLSVDTIANWDMLRDPRTFVDGQNQRSTRTSLTYRDVLKVSKLGNNLGRLLQR